jgi:hypothetical protein
VRTRGPDIKAGVAKLKADWAAREEAEAEAVVDRWNRRLAAGRDMLWSLTIRAALLAGAPWPDVFCPAAERAPAAAIARGRGLGAIGHRRGRLAAVGCPSHPIHMGCFYPYRLAPLRRGFFFAWTAA